MRLTNILGTKRHPATGIRLHEEKPSLPSYPCVCVSLAPSTSASADPRDQEENEITFRKYPLLFSDFDFHGVEHKLMLRSC